MTGVTDKIGCAVDGIDDKIGGFSFNVADIAFFAVETGFGESLQKLL